MSAPFSAEELRALQSEWDAEARDMARRSPRPGAPSLLESWTGLWRAAPAEERRDVIQLACMTPALLTIFALLWWGLPS